MSSAEEVVDGVGGSVEPDPGCRRTVQGSEFFVAHCDHSKDESTSGDSAVPGSGCGRQEATLSGLLLLFMRMGLVAFGGPVAHIAMMEQETVRHRRWISRQHFMDLLGFTNLLPGPNSTQMVMHVGYAMGGVTGIWIAGLAFILPAFLITLTISWFYTAYGALPVTEAVFYGIKPVVVAMIAHAMSRLAPETVTGIRTGLIFAGALAMSALGVNELAVMALGAVVGLVIFGNILGSLLTRALAVIPWSLMGSPGAQATLQPGLTPGPLRIGLLFLRFGATLYGSGYLLVAFIKHDLVDRLGWLTGQQLLDAVAIGQMTPGPVLTTSTAVGYIIAGVRGGVVATVAIFLPSFILVMVAGKLMPVLLGHPAVRAALRGVTPAVLAVMLTVTLTLAREAVVDAFSLALGLAALVAMIRWKVDILLLIGAASLMGYGWMMLG